MKPPVGILLVVATFVSAMLVYAAWLNGLFLRCPYCRKIGSWRYDDSELPVVEKDEDGVVRHSRQIRVCRKCRQKIIDTWSDHEGRTFEKENI